MWGLDDKLKKLVDLKEPRSGEPNQILWDSDEEFDEEFVNSISSSSSDDSYVSEDEEREDNQNFVEDINEQLQRRLIWNEMEVGIRGHARGRRGDDSGSTDSSIDNDEDIPDGFLLPVVPIIPTAGDQIKKGSILECVVGGVTNSATLYVGLKSEIPDKLDEYTNRLTEFYNGLEVTNPGGKWMVRPKQLLVNGDIVVVKYNCENEGRSGFEWRRVEVLVREKPHKENKYWVHYIDEGFSNIASVSEMAYLHKSFSYQRRFAFQCRTRLNQSQQSLLKPTVDRFKKVLFGKAVLLKFNELAFVEKYIGHGSGMSTLSKWMVESWPKYLNPDLPEDGMNVTFSKDIVCKQ